MGRKQRMELIGKINKLRDSEVICYITGDRENLNTRIAPDVIPVIYRHLEKIPDKRKIDLFLYTRGGDVITPWRLVQLIREYTQEFNVLVPYRAYSAGTLICLGADEIIMGKMGELGPIDPSVINAFNPLDPCNPSARVPVNIEDVYSFLDLASETTKLDAEALAQAFFLLAEKIHPLALGNVHRNYLLIRSLARKLLDIRKCSLCSENVEKIVDSLTEKLYAHNYTITRREAVEEIGLPVYPPEIELENIMWELYIDFEQDLNLANPFDPKEFSTGRRDEFKMPAGVVESVHGRDYFIYSGVVEVKQSNEESQINVDIVRQGWQEFD